MQSWQAAEGYSNVNENIGKPFANEPKQICSQAVAVAVKRPLPARATAPANKNYWSISGASRADGTAKNLRENVSNRTSTAFLDLEKKSEGVGEAGMPNEFFGQFLNVGEKR